MISDAIELERVTLARRGRIVLSNVDIAIRAGEFVGVFGPNGAGKTTLLHAILGLIRPAAGRLRVFGAKPTRGNRDAGYLPQKQASVADLRLRGRDFVASAMHGDRWGLPMLDGAAADEVDRVIAMVQAEPLAARPLSELSGGERQRLFLAQALLGTPRLLLLDEPLISLDPYFQQTIVELVRNIQQSDGMTVLFTAHEVNPLLGAMDRVLYLGGSRARLGSIDEVVTSEVLSRLNGMPIDVLRLNGRIVVLAGRGLFETDVDRHA
jgi:zinc/manganese transport system ATP-binding protein